MNAVPITKGNIHAAAVSGDLAEVVCILQGSPHAASERADLDGQRALDYFFALPDDEDLEIAALLVSSGADPRATDRHAMNAIAHAEKRELDSLVDLLENARPGNLGPVPSMPLP